VYAFATVLTHLFVAFGFVPVGAFPGPKVSVHSGVVFDGMIICLNTNGTIRAWDLKTEKYAKVASDRLTRKGLLEIGADDTKLWAADENTVYLWSPKKQEWEKFNTYDSEEQKLLALTPAQGRPFLVFRSKIIDPTRNKDGTLIFVNYLVTSHNGYGVLLYAFLGF
jgi:hypothetical protein